MITYSSSNLSKRIGGVVKITREELLRLEVVLLRLAVASTILPSALRQQVPSMAMGP